ncbi:MAG: hypothetical protein JWP06_455 [Candidatus Saccharibacteria bacterium]|nr:hypothetical protein [Candidatus Saccharibacteria bacterium]
MRPRSHGEGLNGVTPIHVKVGLGERTGHRCNGNVADRILGTSPRGAKIDNVDVEQRHGEYPNS